MCEVAISIPNEVLYDTRMSKGEALAFAKRAVALCYYTQNKISLGYCAQIADIGHLDLLRKLYTEVMMPSAVDYGIKRRLDYGSQASVGRVD